MTLTVECPTCKKSVAWKSENSHRPFCSKRCQLIDLGDWSDESNTISTPLTSSPNELSPESIEDIEALLAQNEDAFFKE